MIELLFKPDTVLLVILLFGVGLLPRGSRWGRRLTLAAVAASLLIAVVPVGNWLLTPLENRHEGPRVPPTRVDGIVVLGGALDYPLSLARHQAVLNDAAERIMAFFALAHRYPQARLVWAGGWKSLGQDWLGDAVPAREFFTDMGVDFSRVVLETKARTTRENAVFTAQLVKPRPGERWLLVTSAWHMPRSVGAFRQVGWEVIPWPVDYRTAGDYGFQLGFSLGSGLETLNLAVREWAALIKYRLWGWTAAFVPGPTP